LFVFPDGPQILPVHIDTVRAAVDLGGAQFDQVKQRFFQSTLPEILFQPQQRFVTILSNLCVAKALFHPSSLGFVENGIPGGRSASALKMST